MSHEEFVGLAYQAYRNSGIQMLPLGNKLPSIPGNVGDTLVSQSRARSFSTAVSMPQGHPVDRVFERIGRRERTGTNVLAEWNNRIDDQLIDLLAVELRDNRMVVNTEIRLPFADIRYRV